MATLRNNERLTGATNTLPKLEDLDPIPVTEETPETTLFREISGSYCAPGGT